MSLDFPTAPAEGAQYSAEGAVYQFTAGRWVLLIQGTAQGLYLPLAGGEMTGPLTLVGAPTLDLHAASKLYVDTAVGGRLTQAQADARYLALAGGTLTGPLVLAGAPTLDLHAASKLYVDTAAAGRLTQAQGDARYLRLAGGTLTGNLVVSGADPFLSLAETDQTLPAGRWRLIATGGAVRLQHSTSAPGDFSASVTPLQVLSTDDMTIGLSGRAVEFLGTTIFDKSVFVSAEIAAGNAIIELIGFGAAGTGTRRASFAASDSGSIVTLAKTNGGTVEAYIALTATDVYLTNVAASPPGTGSVITRERGDGRYLQLAGGAIVATAATALQITPSGFASTQYALVLKGKSAADNALVVRGDGVVAMPVTYSDFTTASAANLVIAAGGLLSRSTSSGAGKTNVQSLRSQDDLEAVLAELRPVTFTSSHPTDDPEFVYAGFIAEEVNAVMPEAVMDGGENYDSRAVLALAVAVLQDIVVRVGALEGATP